MNKAYGQGIAQIPKLDNPCVVVTRYWHSSKEAPSKGIRATLMVGLRSRRTITALKRFLRVLLARLDIEGHANSYSVSDIKKARRGDVILSIRSIPIAKLGTKPRVGITFLTAQMSLLLSNHTPPMIASNVAVMTSVGTL